METGRQATEGLATERVGTHDFANPPAKAKAIDLAMRQYFGADDWLAVRNRLFPGLRSRW